MTSDYCSSSNNSNMGSGGSPSFNSARWITEEVFKLIDMVQRDEAIYNPRHKYYFCRPYVENFWREVDIQLEKNPGASLAKWTNLRISFRREYTNYLEEKVPPCWTYFDRMFFLHPYLRKKQSGQTKPLDMQVQDALAHISTLSNRLQREITPQQQPQRHPSDNFLEYFDETEHNNSELEDIMEEEQNVRDIKSECEDTTDEYDLEQSRSLTPPASSLTLGNEHKLKQQINRLQTRAYHDDWRAKRPCSQENISVASRVVGHANVSFVRPTISKLPHVDAVGVNSTPTVSVNNSLASQTTNSQSNNSELCDCKQDPDAMFLMSLLPDIQKLNGRDRGKIKIAFQNILQDYLYPD